MHYKQLGSSPLKVSYIALGSMTWGKQNDEKEAWAQIDYALDQGVNFIDTAEMYPVPPSRETQGLTEQYIGTWLSEHAAKREQIILATKIAGSGLPWIRQASPITRESVEAAIDGSLERLKTDYIDLYQLHWPNRQSPHFSKHWPGDVDLQQTSNEQEQEEMKGVLEALGGCIKSGKIRHYGLSNETPWGLSQYLRIASELGVPQPVSIQNEFSLLHAKDAPYLLEMCLRENVAYLPWSPIAGGALSGKYRNGARPNNCRWTIVQRNGIFRDTTYSHDAIEGYHQVAEKHELSLTQMALAWVLQTQGVCSTIIGATSLEQLKHDLAVDRLTLSEQAITDITTVFKQYPAPF